MATSFQVTFDSTDPSRLGAFWAQLLGYVEQPPPPGFASWDAFAEDAGIPPEQRGDLYAIVDPDRAGPRLLFQRVPEGKTAKNRMHLDVNVSAGADDRAAAVATAVERATTLGARKVREYQEPTGHWVWLTDPEGNEFCLQ